MLPAPGATSPYFFAGDPASFTTQRWLNRLLGVKTAPLVDYAWYQGDSADETHPTGITKPNPWGMVDMLGNVREFCLDWYAPEAYSAPGELGDHGSARPGFRKRAHGARRSYRSDAADLRCAARDHTREEDWLLTDPQSPKSIWWYSDCTDVGFRVVREVRCGNAMAEPRSRTQLSPARGLRWCKSLSRCPRGEVQEPEFKSREVPESGPCATDLKMIDNSLFKGDRHD